MLKNFMGGDGTHNGFQLLIKDQIEKSSEILVPQTIHLNFQIKARYINLYLQIFFKRKLTS